MSEKFKAAVVQAAPVFMDLGASVEKAIGLIEQAARQGSIFSNITKTAWWWVAMHSRN